MKNIIIAEDDRHVRNNLEFILSSNDFEVHTAADGLECYNITREIVPDLIISDIMMPKMDGIELLGKIRNGGMHSTVPFIFLTAKSSYEELREGMAAGADDYLFKPFNVKDLLSSVNSVLGKYEKYESRLKELRDNIALTVPHEFRTPLTAILGYSEILKEEAVHEINNVETKQIINSLSDSAKRFNNLVQKFTNYTNIVLLLNDEKSLDKIKNRTVYSSRAVISAGAIKAAEKQNRLKDLELVVVDTILRYDEAYLSFIIEELADNAMKYSGCGEPVRITGDLTDEKYVIKVRDSGLGMTREQIGDIDAFNQFSKDALSRKSGNGIGLITVKKIAEQTGLGFNIDSEPGSFTEVIIEIPGQEESLSQK